MATNQMRREAAKRKLARQQERRVQQARRRRQIAVITSVAVVVVVVVGVVLLSTLTKGSTTAAAPSGAATPTAAAPTAAAVETPASIPTAVAALPVRPTPLPATATCAYPAAGQAAKPAQPPAVANIGATGTVAVTLQTSAGAVPLVLDRALAPCTVNSFVSLAKQGYFDNTPCHRLTTAPGLQVLQCGDPSGSGSGGPGYSFADETFPQLTYGRGILAMANSGANTNGSQFFMVYGDGQLPPNYTAFGSISAEGLKVVDQIAKAGDDGSNGSGDGKPVTPVTIQTATAG